ncbi:hypothetical protein [uncultured Ruegeria sp.]|uniref:hypothetical protein n=1 Tax=uncultured Ruegeria sp. TaxID=259304 RepID=UPI0026334A75|nr:hypothetical protein [uncultured Ruegeria sp.]
MNGDHLLFENITGNRMGGVRGKEVDPVFGICESVGAMVYPATAVSTYLLCQAGNKNGLIKLPGVESSIVEQVLSLAYIANQEA